MRHDNYPDDIRQYDHDPRSPFYDDSYERCCEAHAEALEDSLVNGRTYHSKSRQDVDDWLDTDVCMQTVSDIRWLLYTSPEILNNAGHSILQQQLERQMFDRIQMVATDIVEELEDENY